jgi:two-component system, LuxR family, response regulator FixJ
MNDTSAPTAYVVDDDDAIRTLWRWLMESQGIAVQTFESAAQFIEAYRQGPGCLVLDLRLPGMSGLELQKYLKQRGIEIPVVFISAHGDVSTAVAALKDGAVDFIEKPFSYRDVLTVIAKAFERDFELRKARAQRLRVSERLASLTEREQAVLSRVVEGKQNKAIAAELDISVKTVEVHRAKGMEKTGAASVAELVQLMLQRTGET